jgi:hypothetical protein
MRTLKSGWICERVNTTPSWPEPIGEQAAYSCWSEVAMMLTCTDLPGIYIQPDTGLIRCLDHVEACWESAARQILVVKNPTRFPATVRLFVEDSGQTFQQLPVNFAEHLPGIAIPKGGVVRLPVIQHRYYST